MDASEANDEALLSSSIITRMRISAVCFESIIVTFLYFSLAYEWQRIALLANSSTQSAKVRDWLLFIALQ